MAEPSTPLLLYRRFAGSELTQLVTELAAHPDAADAAERYARAFSLLASGPPGHDDPWRHHVRTAVLSEETAFSRAARTTGGKEPVAGLAEALRHDLRTMERLHALDGDELARAASESAGRLPSWRALGADGLPLEGMEKELAATEGWDSLVDRLWEHFRTHSTEPFDRHLSFRWSSAGLQPVPHSDPVRLADLIGYERERSLLIENTEILVAGHRANNALLYGPRGTGKSSTIRALTNQYGDRGLRLVQVERPQLDDFPAIIAELRSRPEKFIVFLDDLAFELGENEYAHLKGLLEGGLETRPDNVVVYATSNRRHVVDERFADREGADDVVHVTDTHQHKLSLADRFGLRILLPGADQARYLAIVRELAGRRGLEIGSEELERRALQWAVEHNGFSPRTAQQFLDHTAGIIALRSG